MRPALISFDEACFERLWGGQRLRSLLQKPAPAEVPVGEAWLIADHESYTSTVDSGPWAGRSLNKLVVEEGEYLLGSRARPTIHGRFPLLLKILDAADVLSVQVHPDDDDAMALGEPDVGKTEMWHVLESGDGSELICGLDPAVTEESFLKAIDEGTVQEAMRRFPAPPGTSVFVAAGTVHAIGADILLAEIQQNSDLTYRIYDWDRVDANGQGRELHLEKSARVTHFGSTHGGSATPLSYPEGETTISVLGACRHFATLLIEGPSRYIRHTGGRSFHLILARDGTIELSSGSERLTLTRGCAAMVPAGAGSYCVEGDGPVLCFLVPDLITDVIAPLRAAGHDDVSIVALGGDTASSDLAREID